jgi:hypothetical protein
MLMKPSPENKIFPLVDATTVFAQELFEDKEYPVMQPPVAQTVPDVHVLHDVGQAAQAGAVLTYPGEQT